ncbi:amidohydrolase family protein [Bacillus sp. V3B]|uniref:amidohydrolase family protein n=1 Tax=Bacillus sp. V3B TaxID=2804915 RepID=UPI00210B33FC|nr:amidohydrolase family protein [Bacillus sp. V3B]MCQ6276318.1 amidohydrolase family protein [Bacillus sp. V3B]
MDHENVNIQVLSPMPELLSYWFSANDTLDFSRHINFQLSEFIASSPDRFWGLGMVPLQDPELAAKIGFPTENALAVASLITGGILEKSPNLKVFVSHGGGTISTILPRLNYGWETMEDMKKICPEPPIHYAQKIFYDTLVYDTRTLNYLIETVGTSQLMIGSDYPFVIREKFPGHWLDHLNISEEDKEGIRNKNALNFF